MKKVDFRSAFVKRILMMVYDIFAVNLSYLCVMFIGGGQKSFDALLERALPVTVITILLFYAFKVYSSMWEYAG